MSRPVVATPPTKKRLGKTLTPPPKPQKRRRVLTAEALAEHNDRMPAAPMQLPARDGGEPVEQKR